MSQLKRLLLTASAILMLGAMARTASATLVINAGVGQAPTGVTYVTFDNLALGSAGGVSNGVTVSFTEQGQVIQGSVADFAAPPVLSNNNGALFGGMPDGVDATSYVTTGIGTINFVLPSAQMYFGLLWGSVDAFNRLDFYNGSTLVGTIDGTQVAANANGDQGAQGTYYVNINSDLQFDSVVASSTEHAFEIDNVAYDAVPQDPETVVPEPATLALMGLGLSGLGFMRRKFARSAR